MEKTPAKLARGLAREEVRRELGKAAAEADVDQTEIAHAVGRPVQHINLWLQRDNDKTPSVADLHVMQQPVALALIRQAALKHGYDLAPTHAADIDLHSIAALHNVLRECTEVQLRWSEALADGQLSQSELADIAREAREAATALGRLEASARKLADTQLRAVRS